MSSLVQDRDNADKQIMHALPWVSDTGCQDETRRLEEAVIEAAQRLEREFTELLSLQTRTQAQQRAAIGFQVPRALPSDDNEASLEEMNLRVWLALEPELMPPPPQERVGVSGLRMAAGYAGAIVVAAAVALVVTNGVLAPSISSGLSTEDEVAKSQSLSTTTFSDLAKVASTQARMQPGDEPPMPAGALLAAGIVRGNAAPSAIGPSLRSAYRESCKNVAKQE